MIAYPGLRVLSRFAGCASIAGTTVAHVFYFTYFPDARSVERFTRAEHGAHPLTDFPEANRSVAPEAWLVLLLVYHADYAALFAWTANEEPNDAARVYMIAVAAWHAASSLLVVFSVAMLWLGMQTPATSYCRQKFRVPPCV